MARVSAFSSLANFISQLNSFITGKVLVRLCAGRGTGLGAGTGQAGGWGPLSGHPRRETAGREIGLCFSIASFDSSRNFVRKYF